MAIFDQIDFKGLDKYLKDPDVVDINCRNSKEIWITSNSKGHYRLNIDINANDIQSIASQVAHRMEKEFNPAHPCLEGDIQDEELDLRVSAIHPFLSVNGVSLALRKVSKYRLLSDEYLIDSEYISAEALELLKAMVKKGMNILVIGETGSGKTELLKYLATHINEKELIITIEDSLEFNIKAINPKASCTSFRVKGEFDYHSLIAMSLRQNINWLLLQEARGEEVNDLLEAMSTGHKVMTTMHAKSAEQVPIRIKQMLHHKAETLESIELRVHSLIDVVICLRKIQIPNIYRYVDSIVMYEYDSKNNKCLAHYLYKDKITKLPVNVAKRLGL